MTFWSGDKLKLELPSLIDNFDSQSVDCASYRLRLGEQVFVTADQFVHPEPTAPLIQVLDATPPRNTVVIPPGQFAFLLTEEKVKVPINAIALISMRASFKFKGLINVSGFHVDPGFDGKLLFGVYNAGPTPIVLERSQQLFLIVYADLDQPSTSQHCYRGAASGRTGISADLVQGMTGQVFSPMLLQRQMQEIEGTQRAIANELADIKGRGRTWDTLLLTLLGLVLTIVIAAMTTDFVKASIGGWMKSATDLHIKNVREEIQGLPPVLPPKPQAAGAAAKQREGAASKAVNE